MLPITRTLIHNGAELELVLLVTFTWRHSCPGSHSSSLQVRGVGAIAQIALLLVTMHTKPSGHSSSLQFRGLSLTILAGTQRTTERNPSRLRSKHSIPSSHLSSSQLDGGGGATHLGRGPLGVSFTTHTVSGWHATKLQFITGGGKMQRGLMYCLQFGLPAGQDGGTTSSMHVRFPGHTFSPHVSAEQRSVTSFPFDKRKNVALHSPLQKSALHSVFRKRGHRAPSHGSRTQFTGRGQSVVGSTVFCPLTCATNSAANKANLIGTCILIRMQNTQSLTCILLLTFSRTAHVLGMHRLQTAHWCTTSRNLNC